VGPGEEPDFGANLVVIVDERENSTERADAIFDVARCCYNRESFHGVCQYG